MRLISHLDRLLLLIAALLAAYQVVQGIDGLQALAVACYTVGFGVLVIASLLLIILGFEVLDSPLVAIAATLIPLSLSAGLIAQFLPGYVPAYINFALVGLIAIIISRFALPARPAVVILALVHGVSGLVIFCLPLILTAQGVVPGGFSLVGVGGGLIGIGGLLLSFLKAGRPLLSQQRILAVFPLLLLLTTLAFVFGFRFI
jgi:hypothetical protein